MSVSFPYSMSCLTDYADRDIASHPMEKWILFRWFTSISVVRQAVFWGWFIQHWIAISDSPKYFQDCNYHQNSFKKLSIKVHSTPKESMHFEFWWVITQNLHHVGPIRRYGGYLAEVPHQTKLSLWKKIQVVPKFWIKVWGYALYQPVT